MHQNLELFLHLRPWNRVYEHDRKARQVVNKVNSPYLQVYPDIGNIYNATDDLFRDIKKGNGHIVAAHLKETVEDVFRDME